MMARHAIPIRTLAFGLAVAAGAQAWSQEAGKPRDEALDSLLEKLAQPADADNPAPKPDGSGARASRRTEKPPAQSSPPDRKGQEPAKNDRDRSKTGSATDSAQGKAGPPAPAQLKPKSKPDGAAAADVTDKDRELDELLQKLGETKETPAPDDRSKPGGPAGENSGPAGRQPSRPDQPDRTRLGSKDKEIDDRLEELTGRRRKRNPDDEKRDGPIGQIIKEMRDVEQKLSKPDTGEGTRQEQKQIIKRIDTLIQDMQRSGSSMRTMFRLTRRPGRQPGQQPGQQPGALARGAPPMKPAKPTGRPSNAGGKDIWGHLPAELRQEIENQSHEEPLTSKQELIDRYYLSVGKGKLVREE